MTTRLENWSVKGCAFSAPELGRTYLHGTVFGHPVKDDGKRVVTSTVMSSKGKVVQTRNTEYELGEMCPDYLQFLEDNDIEFDPENPVTIRTK